MNFDQLEAARDRLAECKRKFEVAAIAALHAPCNNTAEDLELAKSELDEARASLRAFERAATINPPPTGEKR